MAHSIYSRFQFGFAMLVGFVLAAVSITPFGVRAQAPHGINSDARDFFIGYMPAIAHTSAFTNTREETFVLVASYQDNNTFTLSYFDANGTELPGSAHVLNKGQSIQLPIDASQMQPTKPGEVAEYKAGHIHSRYPVSVQFYSDGSSAGGMYQAIPVSALGKNYVVAAWIDNPLKNNPGSINRDSSSSEFMIIAPFNNTDVTFVPNSTTYKGVVGCNTGAGSNGTPHPVTVTLQRGQVYWVRSNPQDQSDDLSGSTIVSTKPVAVLGGQERGLLGDPSAFWTALDNDIRDLMIEQITPVEDWGIDYPSIPCMPGTASPYANDITEAGDGDMYRMFTSDPNGLFMDMWKDYPAQSYPRGINLYQAPAAEFDNITEPVDLLARTKDAAGNPKKFYTLQYQYFQGHHDWDPNRSTAHKKGGAITLSNGGGETPMDEESYRSANEMNLVPIDRWKLSTVFCVPKNSWYRGYQFVNIITYVDSLRDITVIQDNNAPTYLQNMPVSRQYQIPLHPELTGLTLKLAAGTYIITGNTPFVCYSYGRTETVYKDIWGYAAPTGQAYGDRAESTPPRADITPSCDHWDVRVYDDRPGDEGIADVSLLEDPSGFTTRPPHVSYNCRLNPSDPTVPPFVPGDTSLSFQVLIADLSKDAYAAIFVQDKAGNDTVIELHYKAAQLALSQTKVSFSNVTAGESVCSNFTLHIGSTGSYDSVVVTPANFLRLDKPESFSYTSKPALPATVRTGDSIVFTVCFLANDTNFHRDSLVLAAGCLTDSLLLTGVAQTPIIYADDHDFQDVAVGDTLCANVRVQNRGNGNLILTTKWVMQLNPDYTFNSTNLLPDTLKPGQSQLFNFCFHPSQTGPSDSRMDWGTNLTGEFAHQLKDTSQLLGYGIKPGLNWQWHNQLFTVECETYDTVFVNLVNPSFGSSGSNIMVDSLKVVGPDASEFTILGWQNINPLAWELAKGATNWVKLQFKADLSKGYSNRHAEIVVIGHAEQNVNDVYTDTLVCTGIIRHAIVGITPPSYDFGAQKPGTVLTQTFTITNTGDTDFVYTGITLPPPDFTILSGPSLGSHLAPGGTDTIVVQYVAAQQGGLSMDTLAVVSDHPCALTMASIQGLSGGLIITAQDVNFPLNYICLKDSDVASTTIVGNYGAILDSVQITNGPGANDADQFVFADSNSQLITVFKGMLGQTVNFPVRYTPTKNGPVTAIINFYFNDTSDHEYRVISKLITGIGYSAANALSVRNPVAGSNGAYTAVTAGTVSVPVQLTVPFDSIAQVYGIQFNLRYYRDAFQAPNVTAMGGMQLLNNPSAEVKPDPADNNYELLPIHVSSTTPITNLNTVANVSWQYVVAKDSVTTFQIKDLLFLDQNQSQVCWVTQDTIPANFYGTNVCGDNTLRTYLRTGGIPAFSIDDIVPNPVTQSAHVDLLISQDGVPVTIELYNALGEKVQTLIKDEPRDKGGYQVMLDASDLPSGLYTVFVSTPGFGISKQVVITK